MIGKDKALLSFIKNSIQEDIGDGDHSSLACIPVKTMGKMHLLIKQQGIIAGIDIAEKIYAYADPQLVLKRKMNDGENVKAGDIAFLAEGPVHSLLKTERLVLNIMQRMSGIATETRKYTDKIAGTHTKILDTRKTTPGFRMLEKLAVKTGGGENHRMGLYDMIMLKDNHIDFSGGIEAAIRKTNEYLKKTGKKLKIEVEARSMGEVREILDAGGINRILLDNFTPEETKQAVKMINGRYETESSGMITLKNLAEYAQAGVDFISIGALTHQIKSLDMSLKAI